MSVGRLQPPSTPILRRRLFRMPPWIPVWPGESSPVVRPDYQRESEMLASPSQLANREHQAALLFMVASASTVALRAASGRIESDWLSSCCVLLVALVYLTSAAVYWDLHTNLLTRPHLTGRRVGQRLNVGTGIGSLILSLLNFWNSIPSLVLSLLYAEWLISVLCLVDAWLYFECWVRHTGKSPWSLQSMSDPGFLANWCNVIPAVLYVLAAILGIIGAGSDLEMEVIAPNIEEARRQLLTASETIWFVDSVLFYRGVLAQLRQQKRAPKHDAFGV